MCSSCTPGHYAEGQTQSTCTLCPDGFYAPAAGATECELCVWPNTTTAARSTCARPHDAGADACANKTMATLEEYVRLRREDLRLKTLAELEHSPGGLPDTLA